jgi:hypothetical protein
MHQDGGAEGAGASNSKALESMKNYGGVDVRVYAEHVQSPSRRGRTLIKAFYDSGTGNLNLKSPTSGRSRSPDPAMATSCATSTFAPVEEDSPFVGLL